MEELKVIRPMDFVRLTRVNEMDVIRDTRSHIGMVREVSQDGWVSVLWIGNTYNMVAWFNPDDLETVDNLANLLTRGMANFGRDGKDSADKFYPIDWKLND